MYRIGVDLGGTNIVCGVLNEENKIISKINVKTPKNETYKVIVSKIYEAAIFALKQAGISIDDVSDIGVCSPGTVNTDSGIVEFAGNLGFHNVPLRDELCKAFGKKVTLSNDANAIAYGEALEGAGKGKNSLVAITLGTGVGGGVVSNGRILSGINFAAAEIGHMVIVANGEECKCGRRGCFEAYSSATALIKQTKDAMQRDKSSIMWKLAEGKIENVTAKTAFDGARLSDTASLKVVKSYIKYLSCAVTNLVNLFQPDVLVICGGVSNEGGYLTERIYESVKKERFSKYAKKQTVICESKLKDDAGIIGAALLCKQEEI